MTPWRTIELSQGMLAFVDEEDYERLSRHEWFVQEQKNGDYYAVRKEQHGGKVTKIYMHREILDAQPGEDVDHLHFQTLDNRKSEIRLCTRSQNCQHARLRAESKTGYKGVRYSRNKVGFQAFITKNGKRRYLGSFRDAIAAAAAYDFAALQLFGQFAFTNAMMRKVRA